MQVLKITIMKWHIVFEERSLKIGNNNMEKLRLRGKLKNLA